MTHFRRSRQAEKAKPNSSLMQFREKQQVWLGQVSYLTLDEALGQVLFPFVGPAEDDFVGTVRLLGLTMN